MKRKITTLVLALFALTIYSQNLLDTTSWTLGSGSVTGFQVHGSQNENWRVLGQNNKDLEVILWEARNDAQNNEDGGWNSSPIAVDNRKDYRFTVWIKKTNSNDGITAFGPFTGGSGLYDITTNRLDPNPFFFEGDLLELNKWYLLSGYVYNRDYIIFRNSSQEVFDNNPEVGIFDGETGEKVGQPKSFRFQWGQQFISHRTYLSFDENTSDRQYMFGPRLEIADGRMPSILDLLGVNPDSMLNFAYDEAGNQKTRLYCSNGICRSSKSKSNKDAQKSNITQNQNESKDDNFEIFEVEIFPNPVSDFLTIRLLPSNEEVYFKDSIKIYNLTGSLVKSLDIKKQQLNKRIDLKSLPTGSYLLQFYTTDNTLITKQIVKK